MKASYQKSQGDLDRITRRLQWASWMLIWLIPTIFIVLMFMVLDVGHATDELVEITMNQTILSEMDADVNTSVVRNYTLGTELCQDAYAYYQTTKDEEFRYVFECAKVAEGDLEDVCRKIYAMAEKYPDFNETIGVDSIKEAIEMSVIDIEDAVKTYNKLVIRQNGIISKFNKRIYCRLIGYSIDKRPSLNIHS